MKHLISIMLAAVVAMLALSGCINDDFSSDPGDRLYFSTDTVAFDTVITLQGSATKQFVVYNHSDKQINISSITVPEAKGAKFYINVDGQKGSEFHDVAIRGGDSIYVFVEATLDEVGSDDPVPVYGRIDFVTNGQTQSVTLAASGQDVVRLTGAILTQDTRFTAGRPYVIYDSLTVAPGVTLTIDPGARLLFHDKAFLQDFGTIKAMGTQEQPIVMRGDRLDHVVGKIQFDIMSGQWGGVLIYAGSYGNEFHYVDMHSSSYGLQVGSTDPSKLSLHLFNSVLHNSKDYCMITLNAQVTAEGCEFSDAASGCVAMVGGTMRFTQCTFANYYLFTAISGPNIAWFIQDDAKTYQPLDCRIYNCISYGLGYDVNISDNSANNIYTYNTLFKSGGNDDTRFFNCVWKADPKFYVDRDNYIFDYRLKNGSDAIGKGNNSYCPESCRYDRYGQDRFARGTVDLGAYAWVPADTTATK